MVEQITPGVRLNMRIFKALDGMMGSKLATTIPVGELRQFAEAFLAAPDQGVPVVQEALPPLPAGARVFVAGKVDEWTLRRSLTDPLPDPKYIYHDNGVEGEDDLFEFTKSGAVDIRDDGSKCPDCERLYTEDQVRELLAAHGVRVVDGTEGKGE